MIEDLLQSDDIEMINLALAMMEPLPVEQKILLLEGMNARFTFAIIYNKIHIRRRRGLWEQLTDNNKIVYDNKIDLRIFEQTISEYLNNKDEQENQWG